MTDNGISYIGTNLKIGVYGASHAEKIGVKIYGFPKGFKIDFDAVAQQMARRKPGNVAYSTARREDDLPKILSGIDENGITDGEMIEAVIYNTNQHSSDYESLKNTPRPGHADYTAHEKFDGELDMRGGGKFSGRLTAPIVFAGAICRQLLKSHGINIASHVASIADITDEMFDGVNADEELMNRLNSVPFPVINPNTKEKMLEKMAQMRKNLDSVGGTVECMITGVPCGIGDFLFDGIEGKMAMYLFGIPAVKGVQFGSGFDCAKMTGSQNNDSFTVKNGKIMTETNHCGGILGGISDGMPIVFSVAFKPTPSIAQPQKTVDLSTMTDAIIEIKGRHDPCVVPRAASVVEAAAALCMTDMMINKLTKE